MKKKLLFAAFVALTVVFCVSCTGAFIDPGLFDSNFDQESGGSSGGGHGGGSGTGGGKSKIAKLSNGASYNEVLAKLDEIIAYCDTHPGNSGPGSPGLHADSIKKSLTGNGSGWPGGGDSSGDLPRED